MRKLLIVLGSTTLVAGLAVPVWAVGRPSSDERISAMALGRGKDKGEKQGGRREGPGGRGGRGERGGGGASGGPRYHRLEKGYTGVYNECGWIGCASEWVDPHHGSSPGGVRHFGDRFHYYDPEYYAVTYPETQLAGQDQVCAPGLVDPAPATTTTTTAAPTTTTTTLLPQQPLCKYDPRCDCFYFVLDQPPSAELTPTQPSWAATSSE